jgi:hypothetical protein
MNLLDVDAYGDRLASRVNRLPDLGFDLGVEG